MNPTDEASNGSNAPEEALTAPQHRTIISDKVMDWMDTEGLSADRASEVLGISKYILVAVINKAPITSSDFIRLSEIIPGLTDHFKLGE